MSRRTLTLGAAAALAALGAAVLVALAVRPDGGPGGPAPGEAPGAAGSPAPAGGPDHVLDDAEHGATGGDGEPAAVVWYQQLATLPFDDVARLIDGGVGSDLPGDRRRLASEVAGRFVVADLSGDGRDEFPGWWGGQGPTAGPALACCTDVTVLAAGASGYPGDDDLVLALVVWTATPVNGVAHLGEREASFVFLRSDGAGYEPVDASTVETWHPPGEPSPPPR
ncbi:MAG TPA: hypothetical protein VFZ77_00370 [Acidimicrobiales bacterium]